MNETSRHTTWLQFEQRRASLERRYRARLYKALKHQVTQFTTYAKRYGITQAKAMMDSLVPFEGIAEIIKALYIKAGLLQANTVYGEVKRSYLKIVGFGFNEQWTQEILQYFQLHLLNKAVLPITETTKRLILRLMSDAAEQGLSVEETVKYILVKSGELNANRARVIVRTESVRAMNYGSMIGAKKSNLVMEKLWITAKDERVRSSHRHLDGVQADMDATFSNGCAFPGDPNGSGRETINCRCTLGYVPKRDENGRLIRKPTESMRVNLG